MAIPTLDELKTNVTNSEIKPFEDDITEYLEQASTVSYFANDEIKNHKIIRTFNGKELTEGGIEALKKSLEDSGWKQVKVQNQYAQQTKKTVYVSFSSDDAPAEEDTDPDTQVQANSTEGSGAQAVGTGTQDGTNTTAGEYADGRAGGTGEVDPNAEDPADRIQGNTGKPVNNDAAAVDGDTTNTNTAEGEVPGEGLSRDSEEGVNA